MTNFYKLTGEFRFRYLAYLALFFLATSFIVRLVLQIGFPDTLPFVLEMFPSLLKGLVNDCATLFFVLLLPSTLILLPTDRFLNRRGVKFCAILVIFTFSIIFTFSSVAEFFFWDEFSSRYNFIAVDYLIYTTEVIHNIIESYPLFWLLLGVGSFSFSFTFLLWSKLRGALPKLKGQSKDYFSRNGNLWGRLGVLCALYTGATLIFFFFSPLVIEQNRFWNEYAKNGIYEVFSAYLNNQLDFRTFYKTMSSREAFALVQSEINDGSRVFVSEKSENLVRIAAAEGPEKKPNVVIVIMESMGNQWLGEYTPNLNDLAEKGISFSNMMSTGTRTVRGIEAIMLSVPPTPGNSIVRRPDNTSLFTLGTMFRERGYDRDFIYGGIGYFDNMNAFFSGNGYTVTDKLDFSAENRTFSNAWGQCDEDLYAESLRIADKSFEAGKPFHQVLLTTSNHRPYSFPESTIDMAQGSRRAAVKYSDYAVGRFINGAKARPWFDNTIFVFIGDHPSSIAGKTEVPADAYGIACILYGERFLQSQKVNTLCSQIDLAPTLLASMGWEYQSQFFGTNALLLPKQNGRAWISTYQLLGFRTNEQLVVLKPDKTAIVTQINAGTPKNQDSTHARHEEKSIVSRAVASYQCAYDLFTNKRMKESAVASYTPTFLPQSKENCSTNPRNNKMNISFSAKTKYCVKQNLLYLEHYFLKEPIRKECINE